MEYMLRLAAFSVVLFLTVSPFFVKQRAGGRRPLENGEDVAGHLPLNYDYRGDHYLDHSCSHDHAHADDGESFDGACDSGDGDGGGDGGGGSGD